TSPTLRWTGKDGDVSVFRVWGSRAFVRDTSADKLSARAIPCVFLGFPPDAPSWKFYHPTSRCVFPSQDVTFDELVPFYLLFPYRSAPPPHPSLFLAPGPPPVDPLPPKGPAPSSVSQIDALPCTVPVEVVGDSGAAPGDASVGAEPGGAESEGAGSGGVEHGGAEPGGAEPEGVEPGGVEPEGVESEGAESVGAEPKGAALSGGPAGASRAFPAGACGTGGTATARPRGARTRGSGAGGTGAGGARAGRAGTVGAGAGGTGMGVAGAGGAGAVDPGARGAGGTVRPRPYFIPLLQQVLVLQSGVSLCLVLPPLFALVVVFLVCVLLLSRAHTLWHFVLPLFHCVFLCRLLLSPLFLPFLTVSLTMLVLPIPLSLTTVITDPSFEFAAASALVAELVDFAATCHLDNATGLIAESESAIPPSVGGECALGTDVFEERQEDFECLTAAVPRFASMLLAHEGDPDAPGDYGLLEEIWLRRPPGFTGSFPADWHETLWTTLAALRFTPSTADPSFLCIDVSLPPFYVLVYVDDLVFTAADTEALPLPTPLSTGHSLLAPPSDESVEPSGPYPELVGCLMYLMTCTRPDLAYLLRLLDPYVAPGRHQKVHWDAAKGVLRYLCSTLGMGLVLGGRGPVVLTGHADASWVDDSATQHSSQGYTFSLGSGSVSWRSTRSSSVLSSSCEAEIYAGAMAAQELCWLTYLMIDLGEQPRSPPVLYVDNKAMIALC
ncbi:unnamed protein product, partial [Closterium sp. NIES-54]